jgi:hypothetical protein
MRVVIGILFLLASFATGLWLASRAQADTLAAPIVGAWTLNKDLSDSPAMSGSRGDDSGRNGRGGGNGGGYGRGGGRRGGFGGGGFGGGRGGGMPAPPREDTARRFEALRDIMQPPDRMTVTATDSMVIVTTGDGRTTRLALDGKKVKDDSTGIERKTKWDGSKLVTEITGAGSGTITQTYEADPEHHRLTLTLLPPKPRNGGDAVPRHFVYESDAYTR